MSRVKLSGPVSLVLPSPAQTLLLRSALLPAEPAAEALESWQLGRENAVDAFVSRPGGGRLLAPLILHNLRHSGAAIGPELLTYLRTATVREEMRAREYWRICGATLRCLAEEGIETIALKGAALGQTVYPELALRHSHDIDLLVLRPDFERAAAALKRVGFEPDGTGGPPNDILGSHVHRSGLPLALHTGLFTVRYYNEAQSRQWDRAVDRPDLAVPAQVLCPEDQLLHVCAHAATGWHRDSLLWVCDAWFTIHGAPALDWEVLVEQASRSHVALPLYVTLNYLAESLGAPIPPACLQQLKVEATKPDRLAHELALFGTWAGPGTKLTRALRASEGWRERLFIMSWRVVPSPRSIVSMGRIRAPSRWVIWYLGRPVRFAAHRLRSAVALMLPDGAGRSRPGDKLMRTRPRGG